MPSGATSRWPFVGLALAECATGKTVAKTITMQTITNRYKQSLSVVQTNATIVYCANERKERTTKREQQ